MLLHRPHDDNELQLQLAVQSIELLLLLLSVPILKDYDVAAPHLADHTLLLLSWVISQANRLCLYNGKKKNGKCMPS